MLTIKDYQHNIVTNKENYLLLLTQNNNLCIIKIGLGTNTAIWCVMLRRDDANKMFCVHSGIKVGTYILSHSSVCATLLWTTKFAPDQVTTMTTTHTDAHTGGKNKSHSHRCVALKTNNVVCIMRNVVFQ
jgi:hypothetical protein